MKLPSDPQAGLLDLIQLHAEKSETVEWLENAPETRAWRGYRTSMAVLYVERIDRERNVGRFEPVDDGRRQRRLTTLNACLNREWLLASDQRMYTSRWIAKRKRDGEWEDVRQSETWWLRAIELTEDGEIALGLWRERKLKSPPPPLPSLTEREREIVQLAQRAHDLGYALCAREPARKETRQMNKAGWWNHCWVANYAPGLVPSPLAVAEVFPDRADKPELVRAGSE